MNDENIIELAPFREQSQKSFIPWNFKTDVVGIIEEGVIILANLGKDSGLQLSKEDAIHLGVTLIQAAHTLNLYENGIIDLGEE